jgi:hypothetical protein
MVEEILRRLGLDYTARVHLKRGLQSTNWLFWLAVVALAGAVVAVLAFHPTGVFPNTAG